MSSPDTQKTEFDEYAHTYGDALQDGLFLTGEKQSYYARRRVQWLRRCLDDLGERPGAGEKATTDRFPVPSSRA